MRVLLIAIDLYKQTGGGQTVYRKIVESNPDIEFVYFREVEPASAVRPDNAKSVPLADAWEIKFLSPPPYTEYRLEALRQADRFARSVAGQSFDIVDMPDYYTFGSALWSAFSHHRVKVDKLILAMHGNISNTIDMNWGSAGNKILDIKMLERDQFTMADGVYGISPRYIREWQKRVDRPVKYLDPLLFVDFQVDEESSILLTKPSLYCIGRSERIKGNDLFIELVRCLQRNSYQQACHIGDADYSYQGLSSHYLLSNISFLRGLKIPTLPAMSKSELLQIYTKKSVIVLPSRYDTLNLVALEALFSGCPVVISDRAGVCDYLDEYYPKLPYTKIKLDDFYSSVDVLQDLVSNYERHRFKLKKYLENIYPNITHANSASQGINGFYFSVADYSSNHRNITPYESRPPKNRYRRLSKGFKSIIPNSIYEKIKNSINKQKTAFLQAVNIPKKVFGERWMVLLRDAAQIPARLAYVSSRPEYNTKALFEKINDIYGIAVSPIFRCNFWLEIARIERILGNELMAVTYELRVLRLLGSDKIGLLPKILETLERNHLEETARAVEAMYGDPAQAEQRVFEYLTQAFNRNLRKRITPSALMEDHRFIDSPRVSVIVSLYNASDKLRTFLTILSQQTLLKKNQVEVILVDSASPASERTVVNSFLKNNRISLLYARSKKRETIQGAWNRGVSYARADYLVFLGADEMLYPEALEVLAQELDQHPDVDWVMANSLVTAVEENGLYKHDIMPYDRTGGTREHAYLETCYLSWVGGMYKKSLHGRFGYYDETFSAAGDTEFKNRILPYIQVRFISKMLGVFLNYPDGQTTASPKAELEDMRAWYIHRSAGGVRYAFEHQPIEIVEELLAHALAYRKSYTRHISFDIEYALHLSRFILTKYADNSIKALAVDLDRMLEEVRWVEFAMVMPRRILTVIRMLKIWWKFSRYQKRHGWLTPGKFKPEYELTNDNRYEQHSWLWNSK